MHILITHWAGTILTLEISDEPPSALKFLSENNRILGNKEQDSG